MGDYSSSIGHWVECCCHDIFFKFICCKNCSVCLKRPKINEKEAGVGTFKKIAQEFFLKFAREILKIAREIKL